MISAAHAGIYGIAHSIVGLISLITQAINYALIPFTMQSIKAKNYGGLKNITSGCVLLVAVVCTGVTLFAREGILIFATKEYLDAVWFIPPIATSVLFSFIYGILGNIMLYYEKSWQMSFITIICALINIATNYFGIKAFGYIAAGYTTLICSVIQMLAYYFVVGKYEKNLKQIFDIKIFVLIVLAFAVIFVYSLIFSENTWARLGLIFAIIVIVAVFHKKIVKLFKLMLKKSEKAENE